MDGPERGDGEPVFEEEGFLAEALLGDVEDAAVRADGADLGGGAGSGGRDVLELEGDDIDVTSERANAVEGSIVADVAIVVVDTPIPSRRRGLARSLSSM